MPRDHDDLERLCEVQTALARSNDIAQVCDAVFPIVARALRVRTVVLVDTTGELRAFLWGPRIALTELERARDHAVATFEYLARGGSGAGLLGGVVEIVEPRQFVTLPLTSVDGRLYGVFQVECADAFDERDLLFVAAVVNQLGITLERHHTNQQLQTALVDVEHANRRLADIYSISKAALEGETLDESLSAVLRTIGPMFGTDVAAVLLASADGTLLHRRASMGLENPSDLGIAVGCGAAGAIAASGPALAFEALDDLEGVSPTLRANGIRSLLGAPMRHRDRLIGVVYVASREHRQFTRDERQLLEHVVDRLATIIDNAALYDQALAAIRSRDTVMGVVSHDLRNPLGAIQMCVDLLETSDPEIARPVSVIKRSVDTMARLISDLRDVASIEADHLSIRLTSEDACALARDAVDGVRDAAVKKGVRLETRLVHGVVVDCDRVRIIQVLTNLLSNAIKFTPEGGSITVSMTEHGDGACFSVADTGCGIAADDRLRVFDRYWQAPATAHLGTGLGLAIAKGIVEAHRGAMSVESTVGSGTTFAFTIPGPRSRHPRQPIALGVERCDRERAQRLT